MRRLTAILLLPIFLFGALVPVQAQEELTKLSSLLEHFQEHKLETPELTFFTFLKMHYGEEFANHRSAHDHSELPMKTAHNHAHVPVPVVLPSFDFFVPKAPASIGRQLVFADQSYSFTFPHDIWQPPKSC